MKKKETYIMPCIHILPMQTECLLETISLPVGPGPSPGGGDAKGSWIDEEEDDDEELNPNAWGEPLF